MSGVLTSTVRSTRAVRFEQRTPLKRETKDPSPRRPTAELARKVAGRVGAPGGLSLILLTALLRGGARRNMSVASTPAAAEIGMMNTDVFQKYLQNGAL